MSLTIIEPVKFKVKLTERPNVRYGMMDQEQRPLRNVGKRAVNKIAAQGKGVIQKYQEMRGDVRTGETPNFFCLMRCIILNMVSVIKNQFFILGTVYPIVDNMTIFMIYFLDYISDIRQTKETSKYWGKIFLCLAQAILYLLVFILTIIIMVVPVLNMVFTVLANIFYVVRPIVSQ